MRTVYAPIPPVLRVLCELSQPVRCKCCARLRVLYVCVVQFVPCVLCCALSAVNAILCETVYAVSVLLCVLC